MKMESRRKKEVLQFLCEGLSVRDISRELILSQMTVEIHIEDLRKSFETKNFLLLCLKAIKEGYAQLPSPVQPMRPLENRELQALILASNGLTQVQISEELMISQKTLERVLAGTRNKLNASNSYHAALIAISSNLIPFPAL